MLKEERESWYEAHSANCGTRCDLLRSVDLPYHLLRCFCVMQDGVCNITENAVDRHARDRGTSPALIYHSSITGQREVITFAELKEKVNVVQTMLYNQGVRKGDRVGT